MSFHFVGTGNEVVERWDQKRWCEQNGSTEYSVQKASGPENGPLEWLHMHLIWLLWTAGLSTKGTKHVRTFTNSTYWIISTSIWMKPLCEQGSHKKHGPSLSQRPWLWEEPVWKSSAEYVHSYMIDHIPNYDDRKEATRYKLPQCTGKYVRTVKRERYTTTSFHKETASRQPIDNDSEIWTGIPQQYTDKEKNISKALQLLFKMFCFNIKFNVFKFLKVFLKMLFSNTSTKLVNS